MSSALAAPRRSFPWVPVALGAWAAAIALAPDWRMKVLAALPAVVIPLCWWALVKPWRWIAAFFAAALLLPPLPIAIGNSGPHPALALAALGLFCGVARIRDWQLRPTGLNAAIAALFGVLLASVAAAAFHSGAVAAAGSLARVGLFGIAVYVYFYAAGGPGVASPGMLRYLYWIALAAALFACIDFYFQFPAPAGYGAQFVWLDSGVYRRAQGLFYEASTLGNFCAFFLVMTAVAFTRPRRESPLSRKALVTGGAVFLAAFILSYSRGSAVNLAVALGVLLWCNRQRVRLGWLAAMAGAGAVLTWKVFPLFVQAYWLRLTASAEFFFSATEGVLSGRLASWRTLLGWAAANPWQTLFGIGYKTLPYTNYLGAPVVADNMYLSLLVETGVAGLAALLWLHVAILRAANRAARQPNALQSFCGTWMLCFWAGEIVQMLSGDLLTYWRVLPLYFWVLALAVRP